MAVCVCVHRIAAVTLHLTVSLGENRVRIAGDFGHFVAGLSLDGRRSRRVVVSVGEPPVVVVPAVVVVVVHVVVGRLLRVLPLGQEKRDEDDDGEEDEAGDHGAGTRAAAVVHSAVGNLEDHRLAVGFWRIVFI